MLVSTSEFSCFLVLLAFFLCRSPLVAALPAGQPLRGLPLDQMHGYFREGKYLPFIGVFLTSWIESGKPTTHESAFASEMLEAVLRYVHALGP